MTRIRTGFLEMLIDQLKFAGFDFVFGLKSVSPPQIKSDTGLLDGVKRHIVCLENKKCTCGQFQLDELPCAHALAALRDRNEGYENYCSPYYTRESLLRTYEIPVNPLPDESKWNVPQHISDEVVNPPTGEKKQPGRPQKERYKTYDELKSKKYKVSCGNYGGEGHNKRSCKNAPNKNIM
ncbi:PREDICTED: uncharacterized protein LOC109236059 [Nicotiana attenuata]|uniref:uncharacterized protein LOC109236059 n=1 Tax=Nicotiana attenuata TaxID=49451 RepID=UPI0009045F3C|nr:PREDICTED: uncharacterized protein LOC109236059 [Nicotiana attenuata]